MNTPDHRSVLVLDSGMGGMTVVKEIRALNANITITYISDNAYFPYGALSPEKVIERLHDLVEQSLNKHHYDAVVIACNTASTVVLGSLRRNFPLPFVGVVPPIKVAGEISKTRTIGLMATEGTIKTPYINNLIKRFADDCTIIRADCRGLADIAEDKLRGKEIDKDVIKNALSCFQKTDGNPVDVIILGCTHYPLLLPELQTELDYTVTWVEPSQAVVRQLVHVLKTNVLPTNKLSRPSQDDICFTSKDRNLERMAPFLSGMGFSDFIYV